MTVPVMAILNLVLSQQIYSEETNGAHAHNRDRFPSTPPSLKWFTEQEKKKIEKTNTSSVIQWISL